MERFGSPGLNTMPAWHVSGVPLRGHRRGARVWMTGVATAFMFAFAGASSATTGGDSTPPIKANHRNAATASPALPARNGNGQASHDSTSPDDSTAASAPKPPLDRSGRKRVGKASYYAKRFAGKKMADGSPMRPQGDNAASKTLPLGTTAKVTNLETGKSAVVTIEDRGPYVKGRIVDLSPTTAQKIGIDPDSGVAKVEVAPIAVPQPGTTKPEAAAKGASKP